MSLALKVLIALVLGLAAGLGASVAGPSIADPLATLLQPVGTIWVSAIRMAIIPLVVSSLLLGVGRAPDARTVGVLGARGLLMFLAMLTAAGLFSLAIAPVVFSRFHVDAAAAEALGPARSPRARPRSREPSPFPHWRSGSSILSPSIRSRLPLTARCFRSSSFRLRWVPR